MKNKTLSIFIDESGDFGEYSIHSPYYIIALVIHEQYNDINNNIQILNDHIQELGYKIHAILPKSSSSVMPSSSSSVFTSVK